MQADSYGIGRRRRATFLRDGAWGQTGSDPEMRMRYQLAGIVHILAISGLHISILGMGFYNLLKKIGLGIWPAGIFHWGNAAVRDHDRREYFHHAGGDHVSHCHGRQDHWTDL